MIPICLLLHLDAGINLETFIVSTFGYKPSSSTDTNNRKTAIRTKLKSLSLFSGSEKSPRLPLLASVAPELLLLTLLSPWCLAKVFFAGSTGLPPDPRSKSTPAGDHRAEVPPCWSSSGDEEDWDDGSPSMLLLGWVDHLEMRKI